MKQCKAAIAINSFQCFICRLDEGHEGEHQTGVIVFHWEGDAVNVPSYDNELKFREKWEEMRKAMAVSS